MNYVYDLLLNFQDPTRLVEFFEWGMDDTLDHVKKIPLVRISTVDMDNFCFGLVKVGKEFLEKIKYKTLFYKKMKSLSYACVFCDTNRAIAIEFSKQGEAIAKSCLLIDEEREVIERSLELDLISFSYKVLKKDYLLSFLTRKEEFMKKYLVQEISSLVESVDLYDVDKLNYFYEEVFGNDNISYPERCIRLLEDIEEHFDSRYHRLYDIVRLSYKTKAS
jgi:hypothetical protein